MIFQTNIAGISGAKEKKRVFAIDPTFYLGFFSLQQFLIYDKSHENNLIPAVVSQEPRFPPGIFFSQFGQEVM